jgi:hypothetical protein
MATEDHLMSTQGAISERRLSISEGRRTSTGEDRHSGDRRPSVSEGRRSSVSKSTDSVYGVQSLEEALGDAFGDQSKGDQRPDSSSGGLAALLGLKRRKTITSADGNEKNVISDDTKAKSAESSRQPSPRDTQPHHHHAQQSSRAPTISQPRTPLQLESPVPNSAIPSTPKSGSFRSLHLSDEDEETEDATSQAIASSGDEEEYEHEHGQADIAESGMPELVMPSLSMPARRPFTIRGNQMGRLKVCVAGPSGITMLHDYSHMR